MITEADIEKLFEKHLALIADPDIKSKTVKAWVIGCKMGKWASVEELLKIPFTLLTNTHGVNFIEHTLAVTDGAIGLAKAQALNYKKCPYPIDMDVLVAGGILHDVGKLLEIEKVSEGKYRKSQNGKYARHPISGAILCAQVGLPMPFINISACHSKEGDGRPQCIEVVLIHQADFATFTPMTMLNGGLLIDPDAE